VAERIHGVWAAAVTPIGHDLLPNLEKAVPYYRDLLATGCDGINLFGTTGEAMSFGSAARLATMQAIATSGLPMDRMMVGTGSASLEETATITRGAIECKFAAVLLMPPFFYRDAGDDGIVRYFEGLFARVALPPGSAILYNFPQMSGIAFHADLVDRLIAEFPRLIGGIKDSSNDRALQREVLARHPDIAVFPGSEHYFADALASGVAGCISGSVALWPELAQRVYLRRHRDDAERLAACRQTLAGVPFIPAVRHGIAAQRNDESWRTPMPPLMALTKAECSELERRFTALPRAER
jgi:4-hydroxy-tetrahydrodipicolinate synthase